MQISNKYEELLMSDSIVDVLEGTTFAGKTTIGFGLKFIMEVKKSKKNKHLLSGESIGTIEANIINDENGLLELWGDEIEYYPNGKDKVRLPHIRLADNIIYVCGYSDVSKFKKVLGGQFGVVGIDEINIANMDFVREIFLPRFEYCIVTLNPDNPDLDIYKEVINRSRPIKELENTVPNHIWEELNKGVLVEGWNYWFFTFDDNSSLTPEKRKALLNSQPKGTKQHKTKIEGRRTKGVGLLLRLMPHNVLTEKALRDMMKPIRDGGEELRFIKFSCGVDTSYSRESDDTITFIFGGLTNKSQWVVLEELVFNNKGRTDENIIAPSDIPVLLCKFLDECREKWCTKSITLRDVYVDSADSATLSELAKYKRANGITYNFIPAWKKTTIINRINLENGWLAQGYYLILSHCDNHIGEHNKYSWKPNKDEPEDGNDHTINGSQYGWLPYKNLIGVIKDGVDKDDD